LKEGGRERERGERARGERVGVEDEETRRSISIGFSKNFPSLPFRRVQVDGELHPVPLRLIVAVFGRVGRARVRAQADDDPQGQREDDEQSEH